MILDTDFSLKWKWYTKQTQKNVLVNKWLVLTEHLIGKHVHQLHLTCDLNKEDDNLYISVVRRMISRLKWIEMKCHNINGH